MSLFPATMDSDMVVRDDAFLHSCVMRTNDRSISWVSSMLLEGGLDTVCDGAGGRGELDGAVHCLRLKYHLVEFRCYMRHN